MRAVAEMHAHDRGIDARLDGDAGDRRDAAERLDAHRHRFAFGGGDFDRHRADLALQTRRRPVGGPEPADEQSNADQRDRRPTE